MKEHLNALVRIQPNPINGKNLAREYLQVRILESLQHSGAMIPLAFHGGTALRFLFGIPRFSEGLDFTLENPTANYDVSHYLKTIKSEMIAEGYNIGVELNDQGTIHSAFVHFQGLLYELALSSQLNESFSIKIEVDTRPPAGAGLAITLVRRHITLRLQHHDRSSLLAGKIHAILQRKYTKGRDIYDLIWYLSDPNWPEPNLTLLANALSQTGWQGPPLTSDNWRKVVFEKLETLDWKAVLTDVIPFLEKQEDIPLITLENTARLLHQV
jgi:predicted nucleotidyltransferase component of viral defense system